MSHFTEQLTTLYHDFEKRIEVSNWEQLLERQQSLEADVSQARSNYEDMQNRLAAGLVTQVQVDQMRIAYMSAEASLSRIRYDFWIARLRLDHPYIR